MLRNVGNRLGDGVEVGVNDVHGGIDGVNGVDAASRDIDGIGNAGKASNGVHVEGTSYANGTSEHLDLDLDVLVVGAGFAGCYLLHNLRKENFSVKVVEAGSDLGGVWHWNSYPGARVDSHYPVYAYSIPEVYEDWTWKQQYPSSDDLRDYFAHVDKKLNIKKDVIFNTKVETAIFDASTNKWTITCSDGTKIRASTFIPAVGFAAKRHFPQWKGLDTFRGIIYHSSFWPSEGVDVRGKKMAVVGTGATGIQIAQTCARDADELTVFQRTPNLCLPMQQAVISPEQQELDKAKLPEMFKERLKYYAGFTYGARQIKTFDHTPEEREAQFEELWKMGGFRMLSNNYMDLLQDEDANREAYNFWLKKTRPRITDPEKRDILAPTKAPHVFGGRRMSLEQDFYEQMNKPNVHVVDINKNPIVEVVPEGIVTADGKVHQLDIIALATGFDAITGGLKDMKIQGINGETLSEKWEMGTWTYMGISTSGFPNFFFTYGPQAPTAYSNGPSCVEPQSDWIVDVLKSMREKGLTRINPTREAELEWKKIVNELHSRSLRDKVEGWYMGTNIPGKPREALVYAGGIPLYVKTIRDSLDNGYEGFQVE